jgi:FkbM family methyltransferase
MKDWIKTKIFKRFNVSFSKAGDDIQLMKILNNPNPGVYVDIGSWDPIKASNTYYFYLRNWKGICIDPNPKLQNSYAKLRPKDTFLNCAIASSNGNVPYYLLEEKYSSMNTLNFDFIKKHHLEQSVIEVLNVPTYSLQHILKEHLKEDDRLDFFDIDVEGYDLEVLKTNDWEKYRPKLILIETDISLHDDINSEIVRYLETVNYRLIAKSIMNGDLGNLFLIDNNQ